MEEKLYLRNRGDMDYFLESRTTNSTSVIASLNPTHFAESKLSLKNCQAVANGHDLDIYIEAIDYASSQGHPNPAGFSDKQVGLLHGYIDGFQKAIEVLGDKKYSLKDVEKAIEFQYHNFNASINEVEASLQQTEWEVFIEMEVINHGTGEDGKLIETVEPKLDQNGCLILKRL